MLSLIAMVVLGVTPQATLNVVGSTTVPVGTTVLLDGTKSQFDIPLVWKCSPSDGSVLWTFDQGGKVGVIAAFTAGVPGTYEIGLGAAGWVDATKTTLGMDFAFKTITVGTPVPPQPPTPTDPMAQAALKYHSSLDAAYTSAYGVAAVSAGLAAPPTLASIYAALNAQMMAAASAANTSAFGPWQSQLPPSGTEPTSPAQWALLKSYFSALSQAFGSK